MLIHRDWNNDTDNIHTLLRNMCSNVTALSSCGQFRPCQRDRRLTIISTYYFIMSVLSTDTKRRDKVDMATEY